LRDEPNARLSDLNEQALVAPLLRPLVFRLDDLYDLLGPLPAQRLSASKVDSPEATQRRLASSRYSRRKLLEIFVVPRNNDRPMRSATAAMIGSGVAAR